MKTAITLLALFFMSTTQHTIDFGASCDTCDWFVVVDGVMGGLSEGTVTETPESIIFKGEISLKNNGGFASYRSPYRSYDLSSYKTVTIRYRSTGQNFAFTLANYRRFYEPKFRTKLPITNGQWQTVTVALTSFEKYRLGILLPGTPSQEELENVIQLGFISNTKAATTFEIEVDMIRFE